MNQKQWAFGVAPTSDSLQVALSAWQGRLDRSENNGDYFRDGRLNYVQATEQIRWNRTRRIIERSRPSAYVDGTVLEELAREAATVESYLSAGLPKLGIACDQIMIATSGKPSNHAGTVRFRGAAAVTVSIGLIRLLDALATAVILSQPRHEDSDHPGYFAFGSSPHAIKEHLAADSTAISLVSNFFESWLIQGNPLETDHGLVPNEASNGLRLLRAHALRFIIAHEYSHALVDKLRIRELTEGDAEDASARSAEIRADLFAVRTVARTSQYYDGAAPNVALQGCTLAFKANDLLYRFLSLFGRADLDLPEADHPTLRDRLSISREVYRWYLRDLRDELGDVEAMTVPSIACELIWQSALQHFQGIASKGTSIHPLWRRGL